MEKLQIKRPIYPPVCLGFATLMLLGGLLISKHDAFPYLLAALVVIYAVFGYGGTLLKCLIIFVPLCLFVGLLSWLVAGAETPALQMSGRILLMGLCAVPTISIPPALLTRSFARLRCPRALTIGILVVVRFFPILAAEMSRVFEAMKTRGVRMTLNPACVYRAFLIPLTIRLVGISDTLALSLETRAFDLKGENATIYRPVRFTARDGLFCVVSAATVAAIAAVRLYT
jgi:energy-coupling factor transport system permease protein